MGTFPVAFFFGSAAHALSPAPFPSQPSIDSPPPPHHPPPPHPLRLHLHRDPVFHTFHLRPFHVEHAFSPHTPPAISVPLRGPHGNRPGRTSSTISFARPRNLPRKEPLLHPPKATRSQAPLPRTQPRPLKKSDKTSAFPLIFVFLQKIPTRRQTATLGAIQTGLWL